MLFNFNENISNFFQILKRFYKKVIYFSDNYKKKFNLRKKTLNIL